ncbi:MAG: hypothetical protein CMP49_06580 [Flavobacteriales bacterium]|nr:hypothetical protein [Flavobacteriales bacterium]|tara:strand:- start:1577 stop:3295 length:1719 start_codon:yes stop_codon:yes gene_type:complete
MRLYFTLILLYVTPFLFSQNLEVKVDQRKVGLHESFKISFVLDDSGKNFSPPAFTDFQIVRGPSQSTSTSIVNGDFSQETVYSYILKPKKTGMFTILPATIEVKRKTIGSKPITIQVVKGSVPKKPNTPQNIVSRKVHLDVQSDKTTCYVGEPVVLTYTIYFNLQIGSLSQNSINYTNFLVNDLEVNTETKKRNFKGENYNYAIIKQVLLTPQVSGMQTIEELSYDLVASVPIGGGGFFSTSKNVDYTVVSKKIKINVLDLPKDGRPDDFSGAIGYFNLSTELDKDSININESATYIVKLTGKGNLNFINTPKLNFDSQLEVFEPKNLDKIRISEKGVQGYKKEEYLLVPRYKGTYNMPPVTFNFFNPKTKSYVLLSSKEHNIKVGGNQQVDQSYILNKINKEKIGLLNEDIKFIKTNYNSFFINKNFTYSILFYLCILLAVCLFVLLILNKKKFIDFSTLYKRSILADVLKDLESFNKLLEEKKYKEFQSKLLYVLFHYIAQKFSLNKADLGIDNIQKILTKSNIRKDLIVDYISIIKYLEKCKYSPHEGDINYDVYKKSIKIIKKIDTML